jgi:serine/threonine protein kinase
MTSKGSSGREVTTERVRGTSGYRAPELIRTFHYTNKVDIFAIGCIFFELFSGGRKAFRNDWDAVNNNIESHFEADPMLQPTMFTSGGRKLLDTMLNDDSQRRPSAKKLCSEFGSHRWISFAYESDSLGNNELVIEGFRMAIQFSTVENTVWKDLGDAYRTGRAFRDASQAYCTAISCGYADAVTLMTTIEETMALVAIERRSFDSADDQVLLNPQEGQNQLGAIASFVMQSREPRAARFRRFKPRVWLRWLVAGFVLTIWFLAPLYFRI